jgi:PTS system nitrogen regulatory IIA component
MDLSIRDVAETLQVPENTVFRWINERHLPAQQLNGVYRVNRVQLLEWAALNRVPLGPAAFRPNGNALPRLDDALRAGRVVDGLAGADKAEVLRALVEALPLPPGQDRDELHLMFVGREALGSTALGEGLAVPHPRQPIVIPGHPPSVTVCFLARPLEFGAPDKQPVHTLFAMLSPTVRAHVHLLARLIAALRDPGFREAIRRKAPADELIAQATRLEETFKRPAPAGPEKA